MNRCICTGVLLLLLTVLGSASCMRLHQEQEQLLQQSSDGTGLPRSLTAGSRLLQQAPSPPTGAIPQMIRPAAAARMASPSSQRDYIDSLRDDEATDEPQAPPAPLVRQGVQPKKAAVGVGSRQASSEVANQLLVSMTQPPAAAAPAVPSPQPKRRRRSRTARSNPGSNQQQQQQTAGNAAGSAPDSRGLPAAAAAEPGSVDDFVCPPGIICAQQGSRICGDVVCGPNEKCVGGFQCCGKDVPLCNGRCCPTGQTCMAGRCSPPGSKSCGDSVCLPGTDCFNTATGAPVGQTVPVTAAIGVLVCCSRANLVCGASCCRGNEVCLTGQCVPPGSTLCGLSTVCPAGQQCTSNTTCCAPNSVLCAGQCCASAAQCINNRCEKQGASACGPTGLICPAGKACITNIQQSAAAGATTASSLIAACCSPGQQLCGTACCSVGATHSCVLVGGVQQCVAAGSNACGTRICPANQLCADRPASTCCAVGETICNGACCGVGKVCLSNQCIPPASAALVCGATVCRTGQVCMGTVAQPICCAITDVACGGVCCPSARCRDNQCKPTVPSPSPVPVNRG